MLSAPPAPTPPLGAIDAASLAASVRDLAPLAHRVLTDPAPETDEILELERRIIALRKSLRRRNHGAVALWLDRIEQRLRSGTYAS